MIPNIITIGRILLTPIFIICLFYDAPWAKPTALIVFIIASITDAWDGYIARKKDMVTTTGKFLDPLADKILVSSAFISFAIMGKIPYWMVVLIIFRDLFVTGLRMLFLNYVISLITSRIAKLKTAAQVIAILFILTYFSLKALTSIDAGAVISVIDRFDLIYYFTLFVTLFTVYTGINYLYRNRTTIREFLISSDTY